MLVYLPVFYNTFIYILAQDKFHDSVSDNSGVFRIKKKEQKILRKAHNSAV